MKVSISLLVMWLVTLFFMPQGQAQGKIDFKKDSVNWDELDLTHKPPAPGPEDREFPGEKDGNSGPVIVEGKKKNDLAIVFYDPCGVPLGYLTQKRVKQNPTIALDLFSYAHLRGKEQLFKKIKDTAWGLKQQQDLNKKLKDLSEKIAKKKKDLISRYGKDIFNLPKDFIPETVVIFKQGIPSDLWEEVVQDIVLALNKLKDTFKMLFSDSVWVYAVEDVFLRTIQDEPDDPLYQRKGKIRRRTKNRLGLGFGIVKFGRKGLGGGISLGKREKSSTAVDQWGLRYVGYKPFSSADSAWNIESGEEKNVKVAVIDSGLDFTHPDAPEYIWQNDQEIPDNGIDDDGNGYVDDVRGWNFVDDNQDLTDKKGHGTFVAGIIAAKRNNGIGIAGINPGAQIMVLKVVDEKGVTNSLNIWRALRYAADKGARVINISLAGRGVSKLEQLGINYAYSKGALVVVAGGNQAENTSDYGPVAGRRTFVVGALDIEGSRSVINNQGPNLGLLAPGEDIYSLHSKDAEWQGPALDRERLYFKQSGTSFAAPIVAATASLMLTKNPDLTNRQIEDILLYTAGDLDANGWDSKTGAGVLNAYKALKHASYETNPLIIKPTEVIKNYKNRRLNSIDLYGVLRENVVSYSVEIGRGKKPRKFTSIGEFKKIPPEYGLLAEIKPENLGRSRYLTVRIKAKNKEGEEKIANLLIELK